MALFNDQLISTAEDLRAYESSILEIASTESIDLAVKLDLAQREVKDDIYQFLVDQIAQENEPPGIDIGQVVVTDALFQWHVLHTLELSLRDAYHNQLNDRYQAKWAEYQRESAIARTRYFDTGAGIVRVPVAKAAVPTVGRSSGSLADGTYEIRITWQNAAGQEGAPSNAVHFVTDDGSVPVVSPGSTPQGAVRWNVYAGLNSARPTKQASDIPVDESWTMPSSGPLNGGALMNGQKPDYYLRLIHHLRRG